MEMMKMEISVPKETAELGMMIGKLVTEGRKLAKDGIDTNDIPAALALLMSKEFIDGMMGLEKLPEEIKADKAGVVVGVMAGFNHTFILE